MVFGVIFHMTLTGIPFPPTSFFLSLYTVAKVNILSLRYTALFATHTCTVPALAFSLTQSQIRAFLPRTPSFFTVSKTLMLSPRVLLFCLEHSR